MRNVAGCLSAALTAIFLLAILTAASASMSWDFESGRGHNGEAVGVSAPGLVFSTLTGGDVRFADINSGWYSVTSDNGKTYEDGEYFVSGDVAGYVPNLSDAARIAFSAGLASWFTVGYSSQSPFFLEAYDSLGGLLTSASGPANVKSSGGIGLVYLTVSHPGIAYVVLHDDGGYWLIDNITTDAPVPEPSSLATLAIAIGGLSSLALRRRR